MEQNQPENNKRNGPVLLKINKTQNYAWGSTEQGSAVGRMSDQKLNTYAQFWMGTHPNGQSKLSNQITLRQYLISKNKKQIEFLFKILSIEKCLSIQVHPNQQEAKSLHKTFPSMYLDDKDKPQMFLTLSEQFELFLGFLKNEEINHLINIEPFKALAKKFETEQYESKVLSILKTLVSLNKEQIQTNIEILFNNLSQFPLSRQKIIKRIYQEFKNDVGILVSCILQYHILQKGSCFGIQAGIPHAYIKGQCLQLMKNSDIVIRLGLTPKPKDIANLLKVVQKNFSKDYVEIKSTSQNNFKRFYWNKYQITQIESCQKQSIININADSIGFVFQGQVQIKPLTTQQQNDIKLQTSNVFFIEPGSYSFKNAAKIYIACKY